MVVTVQPVADKTGAEVAAWGVVTYLCTAGYVFCTLVNIWSLSEAIGSVKVNLRRW